MTECLRFIGADPFHELHESGEPITPPACLVQRVHHEFGHEFLTAPICHVLIGAVVSDLDDQMLAVEALQNRHDGVVRQVALRRERLMDLPYRLRTAGVPQLVHDGPFQAAQMSRRTHVELVAQDARRVPWDAEKARGVDQEPQLQSGPQVQDSQVQLGLSQPLLGLPQLQSGPQVHGEQVQFGFAHSVVVMRSILAQRRRPPDVCGVTR